VPLKTNPRVPMEVVVHGLYDLDLLTPADSQNPREPVPRKVDPTPL